MESILYKDAIERDKFTECAITLHTFKEDDEIIQLPCRHCFMSIPILTWLSKGNTKCPVCRCQLQKDGNQNETENENEDYIIIEYTTIDKEKRYRIFTFRS
jgi:hypothetical protein